MERVEDLAITSAWIGAVLQRQKKIPKLEKLLARGKGKQDVQMYLAGLKAQLPRTTMSQWRARAGGAPQSP